MTKEYVICKRQAGQQFEVVAALPSPARRDMAFEGFLLAQQAVDVPDYTYYCFGEREEGSAQVTNMEEWAKHIPGPLRTIQRETPASVAQMQELNRAILREGGFVNPQKNRCIPIDGSDLKECMSWKSTEALWGMTDLVQHEPPNHTWYVGPWGLPDVVPHVCRKPVSKLEKALVDMLHAFKPATERERTVYQRGLTALLKQVPYAKELLSQVDEQDEVDVETEPADQPRS